MDTVFSSIQFLALLLVVFAGNAELKPRTAGQAARLARLERKVDAILKHSGIEFMDGVDSRIVDLLASGQKIKAIKLYREQTGVGLKEAKEYVESLG